MDIESIIALAVIVVGGLISAFKKEKPVQNPNRPVHRQQPHQPQPQHRPQEVIVPQSAPKNPTVETTLEDILSAFGAQTVTTPPPVPKVKKETAPFIPAHDVPSVTLKSSPKHTSIPKTDVPEFAKIHTQMNFVDTVCKVEGDKVILQAGPANIELPPAKAKKLIEGGYDGKTVVLGIRPEDVHDEQMFIESSPKTVIEATIRVYEMLGAEVYLYFDYEGANMTARVDPRTTARTGDTVKFALDAEKIHVFDKETEMTITN